MICSECGNPTTVYATHRNEDRQPAACREVELRHYCFDCDEWVVTRPDVDEGAE